MVFDSHLLVRIKNDGEETIYRGGTKERAAKNFSVIGVIAQIQTLSKVIPIYCVQASLSPKFAHLHQQEAEMFMLFNSLMFTTIK